MMRDCIFSKVFFILEFKNHFVAFNNEEERIHAMRMAPEPIVALWKERRTYKEYYGSTTFVKSELEA